MEEEFRVDANAIDEKTPFTVSELLKALQKFCDAGYGDLVVVGDECFSVGSAILVELSGKTKPKNVMIV